MTIIQGSTPYHTNQTGHTNQLDDVVEELHMFTVLLFSYI
jgi:hypothetical protein